MKVFIRKYVDPGLIYAAGLAFLLNLIIESLGRQSLLHGLAFLIDDPKVVFYNTLLIFVTLSFSLVIRHCRLLLL